MQKVFEPTGVNVEVLFADAKKLHVDNLLISKDTYLLGKYLDEYNNDNVRVPYPNRAHYVGSPYDYKVAMDKYCEHKAIIRQVFSWGMFYITGTMENPKARMAFEMAFNTAIMLTRQYQTPALYVQTAEEYTKLLAFIK